MKILVTGAAGRLGSQVVKLLHEAGHEVRAADLFPKPDSPVKITVSNILNRETCYQLCDGMDQVIHLANHTNEHYGDPQRVYGENCQMNVNIFQAAADCDVKRIIFSSSIQVVSGRRALNPEIPSQLSYLPLDSDTPPNPGNSYALSKVAAEGLLAYYAKFKNISAISIRFPGLLRSYLRLSYFFDGKEVENWHRRHGTTGDEALLFLTQDDAGRLVKHIAEAPDLPGFRVYLPAGPVQMLYRRSSLEIYEKYYSSVPLRVPREQLNLLCDYSRITQEVGWEPSPWPSEEEIEDFKRNNDTPSW